MQINMNVNSGKSIRFQCKKMSSNHKTSFSNFYFKLILINLIILFNVNCKEIDSKTDLQQEESLNAEHRSLEKAIQHHRKHVQQQQQNYFNEDFGLTTHNTTSWPLSKPEISQIKQLNVKCEKNHMRVHIEFDRPFYGMIFSKGHFNDAKCVHLPSGSGHLTTNFDIFLGACGMSSSGQNQGQLISQQGQTSGLYIENTVVIQYDPQVQEIWDQARKLRCTWYDYYEKSVSFRPFNVEMLDAVTANFLGDNIQCWMQIQVGKGPWASEVAGIVKIGQTMTMVLAIKDEENKFDMLVRNCIAHDGKHQPIQLVDEFGCVVRHKIMSKFQKVKNFGNSATVVSYAYFQAFKFPDTMNVHFQCVIQVCRYECPEPVCDGVGGTINQSNDMQTPNSNVGQHLLTAASHLQADSVGTSSNVKDKNIVIGKVLAGTTGAVPATSSFPVNILLSRSGELRTNQVNESDLQQPIFTSSKHNNLSKQQFANLISSAKPRSLKLGEHGNSLYVNVANTYTDSQNLTAKLIERKKLLRARRHVQFQDIKTQKIIQVVAPGDVAFASDISVPLENALPIDLDENRLQLDSKTVCISTLSFASGLLGLICLLIVSSLITAFLYLRMQQISKTLNKQYLASNRIYH